jgi:cAMP-specific phosphodiesterase 4
MLTLQDPKKNFLSNLKSDEFTKFRRVLIDNILFTDIKVHFNLLKDFESRMKEVDEKKFGNNYNVIVGQGDDDVKLLTGMIVHTADFNGGAKVFEVSKVWSERVNLEFSA